MRDKILEMTDSGLHFFEIVFPEINVNGSKALFGNKPLGKNPFYNDGKASLSIFFKNGRWQFNDFGDSTYSGDCFNLAAFHYNLDVVNDFTEICQKINQDLCLGLDSGQPTNYIPQIRSKPISEVKQEIKPIDCHDFDLIEKASNKAFYKQNVFVSYFLDFFEHDERAYQVLQMYYVGTSKKGTCFPQINKQNKCSYVKIQPFYRNTKTDGDYTWQDCNRKHDYLTNLHSVLNLTDFNYNQCLFGEHLTNVGKPIAVVESAKSALFGAVYFPQFVWVSTEGEGNFLNIRNLAGKQVILFPDNNAKWNERIEEIRPYLASVKVSNFLKNNEGNLPQSLGSKADLADYFIFSKQCLRLTLNDFLPKGRHVKTPFIQDNDYIDSLFFDEKGTLCTGTQEENYPANWDSTAPYTSPKAKDFVKLAEIAPNVLKLKNLLKLKC